MIRFVFLDLDDTLLDFHKAEANALRRTLEVMGIAPTSAVIARYSAINQHQWELLEQKKITRQQLFLRRFQILFEELGVVADPAETQAHYAGFLSDGSFFLPGAKALLEQLRNDYDLYIVSNGTGPIQDRRIAGAGLAPYFKKIFISDYMGVNKPSKEFFDRCFGEIPNFSPTEAIIVGDSLTSDMRGGRNAGIKTCWFNPKGKLASDDVDYEIRTLEELPQLLKSL